MIVDFAIIILERFFSITEIEIFHKGYIGEIVYAFWW